MKDHAQRQVRQMDRAPVAITSDGMFLGNVAFLDPSDEAHALLDKALQQEGRKVFIGVVLKAEEVPLLRKKLDDSAADALAWLWGGNASAGTPEQPPTPQSSSQPKQTQRRRRTARKS